MSQDWPIETDASSVRRAGGTGTGVVMPGEQEDAYSLNSLAAS